MRRFASPQRLTLVQRGVPQRRNMRREFITMDELNEKLREQVAYLEGDGQISVIRNPDARDQESNAQKPVSRSPPGA